MEYLALIMNLNFTASNLKKYEIKSVLTTLLIRASMLTLTSANQARLSIAQEKPLKVEAG